jgi:GxxExxY protein
LFANGADMPEDKLLYRELTGAIIGAAMEVQRILGPGFLEAVYEEALAHEFDLRGIAYERQRTFQVSYKTKIAGAYRPDFVVGGKVVVDAKAISNWTLASPHIFDWSRGFSRRCGGKLTRLKPRFRNLPKSSQ